MLLKENWIIKQLNEAITEVGLAFIDWFQDGIVKIFDKGTTFANQTEVVGAINAVTLISCALITVVVGAEILSTYAFETNGDPEGDPMQLLVKTSQILCLICCNGIIYDTMSKLASLLTKDLNAGATPDKVFTTAKDSLTMTSRTGMMILFYLIVMAVFAVKAAIRGMELAWMKILWSVFALDLITVSAERWNAFFWSYLKTFFGFSLQLLAFSLSITNYCTGIAKSSGTEFLYSLGWIYVAFKTPEWLEKYVYSSGLSRMAKGLFSGGMQMAYLSRMMKVR